MSIVAYTGLPGAGKSFGVMRHVILPAVREGRKVYTNIPLTDLFRADFPGAAVEFQTTDIDDEFLDSIHGGAVVVIDEVASIWPSGKKLSDVPVKQREFFTMHRHRVGDDGQTTQIVIVAQRLNQVSGFIRDLVEETYVITNMGTVGIGSAFRVDIYQGRSDGEDIPRPLSCFARCRAKIPPTSGSIIDRIHSRPRAWPG